jgi:hypothetical protein
MNSQTFPSSCLPVLSALSLLCACAPPAPAKVPAVIVHASNLTPPQGAVLEQACTPTGPELCFNAVDDNCNGVIDEGCGLQTGVLQFTIAWSGAADVNLVLETPARDRVPGGNEREHPNATGFHLDRDCPGDEGCHGQNVENIFFDGQEPPPGRYTVQIVLVDLHGAEPPVPVRFGARLGSRSIGFAVTVAPDDEARKVFTFDVP